MSGRLFTSPMFLGFDHLEQILERAAKTTSDGYPPYNIEQTGSSSLRITLAVAGFVMEDLQITQEDNQLVIRGRQVEDSQERIFLYRGIAARQFQRAFVLAEGIEVEGAWLDNGLLHIEISRPKPEVRIKRIEIAQGSTHSRKKTQGKPMIQKNNLPDFSRSERHNSEQRSIQVIGKEK
ncbi:MAG: Hsp20 family protein [Commensalibacter sp.]|nr:Hsp20 family protein [Commensalibacter sp.]